MIELQVKSTQAWVDAVKADFDAFLLDHAANERKASAMALSYVLRYPDRHAILEPLIQLAREELTHFHRVFKIMQRRGLTFERDQKDPYMNMLLKQVRNGREEEFLDRLLLAGVVEARGCERFETLAESLDDPDMRHFYAELAKSEGRHRGLFVELAQHYFDDETIAERLAFWVAQDASAISQLSPRAVVH